MKILHYTLSLLLAALAGSSVSAKTACDAQLTRALPDSAWTVSEWLSAANAPVVEGPVKFDSRSADKASWFMTTVRNRDKVTKAVWMTTALGVYEIYVNGNEVGCEILKPGFTHHAKKRRSFTYDVTEFINTRKGAENIFSAQATPGWWADKIVTPDGNDGMVGRKPAFRGVLELTYANGHTERFGTNRTDWRAGTAGPVQHASIYDGEIYDARLAPGYDTPDKLLTPELNTEFAGTITPTDGAEVYLRRDLALNPVEAYTWKGITGAKENEFGKVIVTRQYKPGETIKLAAGETLVVDFGQNCAAVPEFEFKASEGTNLECRPGEILNDGNGARSRGMDGPEGSVFRENLRVAHNAMYMGYTFGSQKGFVTYRPHFTFFGYRYASVTADGDVEIRSIKSLPVTSISKDMQTGSITTGNADVNQLISNIMWGQRSNYLSIPTDCPQRNERMGWTADTQVFTKTGTYFANTSSFFHKWMDDMRDMQTQFGSFPGVVPIAFSQSSATDNMRVGWSDAGVIVPWTIWKQFGDTVIVNENWKAIDKFMRHVNETKYDQKTLIAENGNFQWADWLSYEPLESFSMVMNDKHINPDAYDYWSYLNACYWLSDAEMMRDMAAATGRDADLYAAMADSARIYIRNTFIDNAGIFKLPVLNTMQTPALFALRGKILEGEARENLIARLRKNFAEHGNCLQTGFLGTSILMPTLTANGMVDIAYELLLQHKNPSWLYSVDNGATTIWERWNSYTIENGMATSGMNSFNHYAYGCVGEWLWETVAGIAADPSAPGFKHIIMKPVPDPRLGYVNAEYRSATGLIKSSWKYEENGKCIWRFTIPEGATASVTLPGENKATEYGPGNYCVTL